MEESIPTVPPEGEPPAPTELEAFERGVMDRLDGRRQHENAYEKGADPELAAAWSRGWNSPEVFDLAHADGAERHGEGWDVSNRMALDAFRARGIRVEREPYKTAIAIALLRALDACCPPRWYHLVRLGLDKEQELAAAASAALEREEGTGEGRRQGVAA